MTTGDHLAQTQILAGTVDFVVRPGPPSVWSVPLGTHSIAIISCRRRQPYALTPLTSNSSPPPIDKLPTGSQIDTAKRVTITEPHIGRQSTNVCGPHCAW